MENLFDEKRFQRLLEIADSRQLEIVIANDYAERGYLRDGNGPILFANWNEYADDKSPPRLCDLFEKIGCSIEWSDEWRICDDCGNAFRISGDSYCWLKYGTWDENGCQCGDCILEYPSDYLEGLEGKAQSCETIGVDLGSEGYVRLNPESFESGLFGGQCDDPGTIADSLRELGIDRFLFQLDSVGQFDSRFSVWVHNTESTPALWKRLQDKETTSGDPAISMRNALRDASVKMSGLSGQGIKYAQLKSDGTADVKNVSPQEFIEGIE